MSFFETLCVRVLNIFSMMYSDI